ncbi:Transmembrane and coiled-coil domains protein 1 [Nymphon striatum]|nr:Transmembrane and coiled-coil domains protein 1 [Nymphon striatum]
MATSGTNDITVSGNDSSSKSRSCPKKKSQTLPASSKPSAIKKKQSKLSHLSPRPRLRNDNQASSSTIGLVSPPLSKLASGPSTPNSMASPSINNSMTSAATTSNIVPSSVSIPCTSTSPAFAIGKQRDGHSGSDSLEDNTDENIELIVSSNANGNNEGSAAQVSSHTDEVDLGSANSLDIARTKAAIEKSHQKIAQTKDMIKAEQTSRDENVDEYLKLAGSCSDKQQLQRIKSVFEKKNQKSAQMIVQLQRKLENYTKKIRDLETNGMGSHHHRQPKEVLRDVSQGLSGVVGNIKGGLSGLSAATHTAAEYVPGGHYYDYDTETVHVNSISTKVQIHKLLGDEVRTVMSKPREFAHLIKNKFGSADNISSLSKPGDEGIIEEIEQNHHGSETFTHSTKYTSDDECSSITSGSVGPAVVITTDSNSPGHQPALMHEIPVSPSFPLSNLPRAGTPVHSQPTNEMLINLWSEIHDRREENQRLTEELESTKVQIQHDYSLFNQALQEERYRFERLEEQMNDLIELHQNEIENLKTGISDMEEKVQYQSEERLNDLHELMDSCQTRISRMEHQQHQHQQLVSIEGIENSNARALVLKLINIVLTFLQVILLLVSTAASIIMPFLTTRQTGKFEVTKVSYLISDGLGPHFKLNLSQEIANSGYGYTIQYDETGTFQGRKQCYILIRFWSEEISVRVLQTLFFGHAKGKDVAKKIVDPLPKAGYLLPLSRLMSLSSGGPNVNKTIWNAVNQALLDGGLPGLMLFIPCNIHVAHNAFHAGINVYGEASEELATDLFYWLKSSPCRKNDYINVLVRTMTTIALITVLVIVSQQWTQLIDGSRKFFNS